MIFCKFKGLQKPVGWLPVCKPFPLTPSFSLFNSKLSRQQGINLRRQYIQNPTINHFSRYLQTSSDYFGVYALMREAPFSKHAYQELEQLVKRVKPQTDNLILLRSKALGQIAQHYEDIKEFDKAKEYFWKAVLCMQEALVPQIVPYYDLYRKYGLLLAKMKQFKEALEVLRESVTIMDQFVAASDDPVSSFHNSLRQAQASLKLVQLDPEQRRKWLNLANREWDNCGHQRYEYREYAETMRENLKDQFQDTKQNPNKVKLVALVEMEMFKNQQHAKIIEQIIPK